MVATTPINALRLAELTDTANAQTAFGNLGTDLDSRLVARFATTSARDAAITSPVPGQMAWVTSFNSLMVYYVSYWGFLPGTPIATLFATVAQTIPDAPGDVALLFDSEEFDLTGGHSTVTNKSRFTPNVPGRYMFFGGAAFDQNGTGFRGGQFLKNGSTYLLGPQNIAPAATDAQSAFNTTSIGSFNGTTDYVELAVGQNSGGNLATNVANAAAYPSMTVIYMGSA